MVSAGEIGSVDSEETVRLAESAEPTEATGSASAVVAGTGQAEPCCPSNEIREQIREES